MNKLKIPAMAGLAAAAIFSFGTGNIAHAAAKHTRAMSKSATITGCLQKGDEAGEYSMKASDGKLYGLTSRKVALKDHVGHQVALRGYVTPESAEKPEHDEPSASTPDSGDIDMTVTSLKMISKTCSQ